MVADILRYFSARLALSYLIFMLGAFGIMRFGEGDEYPYYFIYALFLFSFILSSAILSHLGKWRFNALMVSAQECDITRFFRKGEVLFEKLLILIDSFHFLPQTAEHLKERVYKEYSNFLLALDKKGRMALNIHKKALGYGWESPELKAKLILGFLNKRDLARDEIDIGIRLIGEGEDNRMFLELLVDNCLSKRAKEYDAQEVFRQALIKGSIHTSRILDALLPGALQLERGDPFAVAIYFKAMEMGHRLGGRCRRLLHKLAEPYLLDKYPHGLGKRLVDFYRSSVRGPVPAKKGAFAMDGQGLPPSLGQDGRSLTGRTIKKGKRSSTAAGPGWKGLLPDSTFFYITCGLLFMVFLGYQSFRERPITRGTVTEPLLAAPEKQEALPIKRRKYISFKSELPFTIQVGAYNTLERAERIMSRLRREEKIVYWLPARVGEKVRYRVRLGEFTDRESARSYAKALEKKKLIRNDYYLTNFREGFILNEEYEGQE